MGLEIWAAMVGLAILALFQPMPFFEAAHRDAAKVAL